MKMTRIVLFVLIIVECCVQGILTYWWYKYKSGAYYNLVSIKKYAIPYIMSNREYIINSHCYNTILFTYKTDSISDEYTWKDTSAEWTK